MTMSHLLKNTDKAKIAKGWVKSSLKALKELAPLVEHVPWLGAAAGTFVQALELWDVSRTFRFSDSLFSFMVSFVQ